MTILHSDSIKSLMKAMHKVQSAVDGVAKDSVNPHFKNRYASLESVIDTIRQPCLDAGLVVTQAPGAMVDGALALTTMIAHFESGEWMQSTLHIPVAKADPQGAGSALSYAERYSLMALFCLPAVDDDGEAAQRPPQRQQTPAREEPYRRLVEAAPAASGSVTSGNLQRALLKMKEHTTVDALRSWYMTAKASIGRLSQADQDEFLRLYGDYQMSIGRSADVTMTG